MRAMQLDTKLDLEGIHRRCGGEFHRGRPEMLLLRMSNGHKVQLFRGGAIQIFGPRRQREVELMCREVLRLLRIRTIPPLVILNIVICAQLTKKKLCLRKMNDSHVFYETEIFPAALIDKWEPAHVALFHNGKIVITGIKTVETCYKTLTSLIDYVREK